MGEQEKRERQSERDVIHDNPGGEEEEKNEMYFALERTFLAASVDISGSKDYGRDIMCQ